MGKKILLIDDDTDWTFVIAAVLKKSSYEVTCCEDGVQGLEHAIRQKPDLIILDVLMPNLTGYEFVKKLRNEGGLSKNVPILVVSSRQSMEEYFDSWEIYAFVPKSPDMAPLIKKIHDALGTSADEMPAPAEKAEPAPVPQASDGRKVMLIGVDDYIVHKVKTALEGMGMKVVIGLNVEDAFQTASKEQPAYVFCQYYEDTEKLDAHAIYLKLKKEVKTKEIPFITFCTEAISLDAMKTIGSRDIIGFRTGNDLAQSIEKFLKTHA